LVTSSLRAESVELRAGYRHEAAAVSAAAWLRLRPEWAASRLSEFGLPGLRAPPGEEDGFAAVVTEASGVRVEQCWPWVEHPFG
jgi:hypothetical protein